MQARRVAILAEVGQDLLARGVLLGETRTAAPGVLVCDGEDPEGNRFSIESRRAP